MKRYSAIRIILLGPAMALALLVADCALADRPVGNLQLGLDTDTTANTARNLVPDVGLEVESYDISGEGPWAERFSFKGVTTSSKLVENVVAGTWEVTATGKNSDGAEISRGFAKVAVLAGLTSKADMTCTRIPGDGTLSLNLRWPTGVVYSPAIQATLTRSGTETQQALQFDVNGNAASFLADYEDGYYRLDVQLLETSVDPKLVVCGSTETVLILQGKTTSANWNFTADDLAPGGMIVTVTSDTSPPLQISLTSSLESGSIARDGTFTVTAVAASATPDSWQWYLDGAEIFEAASASVLIDTRAMRTGPHNLSVVAAKGKAYGSANYQFRITSK
jgi:hypothetical protein